MPINNSASGLVREALRLSKEADRLRSLKLERLRDDIREGLESGPSTVFEPKAVKRAAREKKSRRGRK